MKSNSKLISAIILLQICISCGDDKTKGHGVITKKEANENNSNQNINTNNNQPHNTQSNNQNHPNFISNNNNNNNFQPTQNRQNIHNVVNNNVNNYGNLHYRPHPPYHGYQQTYPHMNNSNTNYTNFHPHSFPKNIPIPYYSAHNTNSNYYHSNNGQLNIPLNSNISRNINHPNINLNNNNNNSDLRSERKRNFNEISNTPNNSNNITDHKNKRVKLNDDIQRNLILEKIQNTYKLNGNNIPEIFKVQNMINYFKFFAECLSNKHIPNQNSFIDASIIYIYDDYISTIKDEIYKKEALLILSYFNALLYAETLNLNSSIQSLRNDMLSKLNPVLVDRHIFFIIALFMEEIGSKWGNYNPLENFDEVSKRLDIDSDFVIKHILTKYYNSFLTNRPIYFSREIFEEISGFDSCDYRTLEKFKDEFTENFWTSSEKLRDIFPLGLFSLARRYTNSDDIDDLVSDILPYTTQIFVNFISNKSALRLDLEDVNQFYDSLLTRSSEPILSNRTLYRIAREVFLDSKKKFKTSSNKLFDSELIWGYKSNKSYIQKRVISEILKTVDYDEVDFFPITGTGGDAIDAQINDFESLLSEDCSYLINNGLTYYDKSLLMYIRYHYCPFTMGIYENWSYEEEMIKNYKYFAYITLEDLSYDLAYPMYNKGISRTEHFWVSLRDKLNNENDNDVQNQDYNDFITDEYENLIRIFVRSFVSEISCNIDNLPGKLEIDYLNNYYKVFKNYIYDETSDKNPNLNEYGFLYMLFYRRFKDQDSNKKLCSFDTKNRIKYTIKSLKNIGVSMFHEDLDSFYDKIGYEFFELGINSFHLDDLFNLLLELREENLIGFCQLRKLVKPFIFGILSNNIEPPYYKHIRSKFIEDFNKKDNDKDLITQMMKYRNYSNQYVYTISQIVRQQLDKISFFPIELVYLILEYTENIQSGIFDPFINIEYDYGINLIDKTIGVSYSLFNNKIYKNYPNHLKYLLSTGFKANPQKYKNYKMNIEKTNFSGTGFQVTLWKQYNKS